MHAVEHMLKSYLNISEGIAVLYLKLPKHTQGTCIIQVYLPNDKRLILQSFEIHH